MNSDMVKILLKNPLGPKELIELSDTDLEFIMLEFEAEMDEVWRKIQSEYDKVKEPLARIKKLKEYYKQLKDKRETCDTFLKLDKNLTLLSSVNTISKPISLSEIFKELDKVAKGVEPAPHKTPTRIPIKKKTN